MSTFTVFVVSAGGVVTIARGLPEGDARRIMRSLDYDGDPWSPERILHAARAKRALETATTGGWLVGHASSSGSLLGPGDMTPHQLRCWNEATGEDLVVWPKPDDYDERVRKAEEALDMADRLNAGKAA